MDQNTISTPRTASSDRDKMLSVWQQHMNAEFVLKDADAALATMTENAYVFLAALGDARVGTVALRQRCRRWTIRWP
jgi:hypothetical protein